MTERAFEGRCHCGAIGYSFRTLIEPARWAVRACQCTFCRAHGARTTTDRDGSVSFRIAEPGQLNRYRFGSGTTDFFVCGGCGVYLAAVLTSGGRQFATLNVNAMQPAPEISAAQPVDYDGESADDKRGRREQRWTPVEGSV